MRRLRPCRGPYAGDQRAEREIDVSEIEAVRGQRDFHRSTNQRSYPRGEIPPIEVRTDVAFALTFKRAEYAALQLASVQPMHGPDEKRGGWWARTQHGMRLGFVVEWSGGTT